MTPPSVSHGSLRSVAMDAPVLLRTPFVGAAQLLGWLLFRPSAWRVHVSRIDPALPGDFCLADLNSARWQSEALRDLRVALLPWAPLLVGLFTGLVLWTSGTTRADVLAGVVSGVVLGVAFGVCVSACASLAAGIVGGTLGGSACGAAIGLALHWGRGAGVTAAGSLADDAVFAVPVGVGLGVLGGAAAMAAGNAAGMKAMPGWRQASLVHRLTAVVSCAFVVAIAGLAYWIARTAASYWEVGLPFSLVFSLLGGLLLSIIFGAAAGLRARRRSAAFQVGLASLGVFFVAAFVAGTAYDRERGVFASGLGYHAGIGFLTGTVTGSLFAVSWLLGKRIGGPTIGAATGALVGVIYWTLLWRVHGTYSPLPALPLALVSTLLAFTLPWMLGILLHPLITIFNLALAYRDEVSVSGGSLLLRRHSALWFEFHLLPLWGLTDHLVFVAARQPQEVRNLIERLMTGRHAEAAQAASVELAGRQLDRCAGLEDIACVHREVAEDPVVRRLMAGEQPADDATALVRSFVRLSEDVEAALGEGTEYFQRLALRMCEERLDGLVREVARSREADKQRFDPAARRWRQLVTDRVREMSAEVSIDGRIDSPYIVGVPLLARAPLFVGRADLAAEIERSVLDPNDPPLLLYGQRRMGKTSLLNNLGWLLPPTVVPLFVDLQGAALAADDAGLLYSLARGIGQSALSRRDLTLRALTREELMSDPFTRFAEWLNGVERALGDRTALLALDEFEALARARRHRGRPADRTSRGGRSPRREGGVRGFDLEAVLKMLRHVIQHHPRIRVLLAASHSLQELELWADNLINVKVVRIGHLSADAARQLVEAPIPGFLLKYESDATERVLDLTHGHPFLLQALCAEIVALKNAQPERERGRARVADVETAADQVLTSAPFFFADIENKQVDAAGLTLLRTLAVRGERAIVGHRALFQACPGEFDRALDRLIRRELIEEVDGGYRFRVELIRRGIANRSRQRPTTGPRSGATNGSGVSRSR
jgi:hypothetical protein